MRTAIDVLYKSDLFDRLLDLRESRGGVELIARLEVVVGRVVVEEAVVIGALAVLEALELNLSRLKIFGLVDTLAGVGNVAGVD